MKVTPIPGRTHNPFDETHWVSCLRENLTSSSDGEGLETGLRSTLNGHEGGNPGYSQGQSYELPRQSFTRQNGIKDLIGNYFFDRIPGIDPHRINLHYFVVTLARLLFEMLSQEYAAARNADRSKKNIGTLRSEFLTGVNVILSRVGDTLYLKWVDPYPEKQHQALADLFDRLTQECREGLLFLGGLRLVFSLAPPRADEFHNQLRRQAVEF